MQQAFKEVKKRRSFARIDEASIAMFESDLDANLDALMRELKTRDSFIPAPRSKVFLPAGVDNSTTSPLGIPAARDRVAQECASAHFRAGL